MASGYTTAKTIGTTAEMILVVPTGILADITVQNLSANNLYYGVDLQVSTSSGIKILPNETAEIRERLIPLALVADGASSDVRIEAQFYRKEEK